ncbi:MAG: hypothetical protein Q4B03_06915 [Lachnospiraceae bacterium]|nr:hypothetical protein [Lachnospiraceae bacterium]
MNKIKKLSTLTLVFVIILCAFCACGREVVNDQAILKKIGHTELKTVSSNITDTHGAFHNDGVTFAVIELAEDSAAALTADITASPDWTGYPMNETVQTLVSNVLNKNDYIHIPEISNGYYQLVDRHADKNSDDDEFLSRSSYNFTLVIFNTDTNTLYYCEFDT